MRLVSHLDLSRHARLADERTIILAWRMTSRGKPKLPNCTCVLCTSFPRILREGERCAKTHSLCRKHTRKYCTFLSEKRHKFGAFSPLHLRREGWRMPGPKGKTPLLSCLPEEGLYFHLLPPPLPQGNSTKVPPPTYLSPEEEKCFFRGHGREGRWHSHSLLLGSTSRLDVPLDLAQSLTGYIFCALTTSFRSVQ